ncbi:MAG TPA: type II toxin-antitoxin system PemK/MazF family toxin [Pyrinomonadaceae bacterium]|nr:type II toxin-antitoxin system PemK/MazF family toxin [Pyrinomonadaceae bacterium]
MQETDIVLAYLPQSDGTLKRRPALILREMPKFKDFLVCGISTQLHQKAENFDELITPEDTDFSGSGLKSESLIRLGFLAVLATEDIIGKIGTISAERHQRLLKNLSDYLMQ